MPIDDTSASMTRREALAGLTGAGLVTAGAIVGVLGAGCSTKQPPGSPVRVISAQGTEDVTLQRLMVTQGYFRTFDLAPQVLAVNSGTSIIGALLRRNADICVFSGFSELIAAIERGADLKILGGASVKGQQTLFSRNPAIQYVRDLVGRTVGVGAVGAQLYEVAAALLEKKGVGLDQVRFVDIGSSADVFRAVVAGTVDAGDGEADVLAIAERFGVHALKDGDYATQLPEYTWQASFTSTAAIREMRATLVRTLAAYCKAFRYVQSPGSRDAFIAAQLQALRPRNSQEARSRAAAQWDYVQSRKPYAADLELSEERVQYMQELNIRLGVQKKILPYDQLVDPSLAREAVAMLDR
jgi:ABC-type nitrate/sulfonate/bicarbonate transport system substrate-binding protein